MAKRITLGKPLGGFLAAVGLEELALAGGHVFFVNPGAGSDTLSFFDGKSADRPYATTAEAFANTADGKNDVVVLQAQPTSDDLAAAIAWNQSYTHLVGTGGGLVQTAGRARIHCEAAAGPAQLVTFSGNGCKVANIQFYNGPILGTASGAVIVSGDRNKFANCHFAGMGDATSAAVAGSFSLQVTGNENEFHFCTIGLDTITRGASNVAQLLLGSASSQPTRNFFNRCRFVSASETAAAFMAEIITADRYTIFRDCTFYNFSVNHTNTLANCFKNTEEARTHDIILEGDNRLIGIDGWADTVSNLWIGNVGGAGTYGIKLNPTT
jgi:hypothetical protein